MTGNDRYEKARALFLALVMVISVFGMTVAFGGGVAATDYTNSGATDSGTQGPSAGDSNVSVMELKLSSNDQVVNDHDGTTDAVAGDVVGTLPDSARFVNQSGTSYGAGAEVYLDEDGDAVYTGQSDTFVAGTEPSNGATITDQNGQNSNWDIDALDANDDGNAWDGSNDVLLQDFDEDQAYTAHADDLLNGSDTNLAEGDGLTDGGSLDGAWTGGANGDLMYYDANDDGGAWNSSADAIWIEGGGDAQYISTDDTLIAGTEPSDNTANSGNGLDGADWANINVYDNTASDDYDDANDAIIKDYHDGKTYSTQADNIVAGDDTINDGYSGAQYNEGSFDGDWSLDSLDATTEPRSWNASEDAIVIDVGDRGTYSASADTVINYGNDDTQDVTDGQDDGQVPDTYGFVDVDDSSDLTQGDEIYTEGDGSASVGDDKFGDALNAITVNNTGNLSADYIDQVKLFREVTGGGLNGADDSQVASTQTQDGSVWAISGQEEYFGPDGQTFYVAVDLASDTPEKKTLDFQVPAVSDNDGSYASGDTGMFYLQGDTQGDVVNSDQGTVITVNNPPESLAIDKPSEVKYKQSGDTLTVAYNYNEEYPNLAAVTLDDTDGSSSDATYTYEVQDGEYTDDGNTKTVTLDLADFTSQTNDDGDEDLLDGAYNITLNVDDEDGATNSITSSQPLVVIDDFGPEFSDAGVTDNTDKQTTWTVNVSESSDATASDENSSIDEDAISATVFNTDSGTEVIDGDTSTEGDGVSFDGTTLTVTPSDAGITYEEDTTYAVNVSAADRASNTNTQNEIDSFTIRSETPAANSVEAEVGTLTATVTFSEDVVAADDTLSADDFAYEDTNNAGATEVADVQNFDDNGDNQATLVFDAAVVEGDLNADLVSAREDAVEDADDGDTYVGLENVPLQDTEQNFDLTQDNITASSVDIGNHDDYTVDVDFWTDEKVTVDLAINRDGAQEVNASKETTTGSVTFSGLDVSAFDDGNLDVDVTVDDYSQTEDHSVSEKVSVTKDTAPEFDDHSGAESGSDELVIDFDMGVENGSGQALSADNFTYENGGDGVEQSVESVDHTADASTVTVNLNESLTVEDLGEDQISIEADEVFNLDGTTAAAAQSLTVTDSEAASPVNIVSPSEYDELSKTSGDTLQFTYNYEEDNPASVEVKLDSGADTYTTTLDDSQYSNDGINKTVTLDLDEEFNGNAKLADGVYSLVVTVTDAEDNEAEKDVLGAVQIDDTKPDVGITGVDTAVDQTESPSDATTSEDLIVSFAYIDDSPGEVDIYANPKNGEKFKVVTKEVDAGGQQLLADIGPIEEYSENIGPIGPDNTEFTFEVSATDELGHTNSHATTDYFEVNDAAPAINSVEAHEGENYLDVYFTEAVSASDGEFSADDFAYEDVSGDSASAVGSAEKLDGEDQVRVYLNKDVTASDVNTDLLSVRDGAVVDQVGAPAGTTGVELSETKPTLNGIDAKEDSDTVNLEFSEPVEAADGGNLTADNFSYTDTNEVGATGIESVHHEEGWDTVYLVLNDTVNATDLGNDSIDIPANSVYDSAKLTVDEQSVTLDDTYGPKIKLDAEADGHTVTVNVTANEELGEMDVSVHGQNYMITEIGDITTEQPSSYTLTEEDFSPVSESDHKYTATVEVSQDDRYEVEALTIEDRAENPREEGWKYDYVNVDASDVSVENAVIQHYDGDNTKVDVRFDEPVEDLSSTDISIDGTSVDDLENRHEMDHGLITIVVSGELPTGDEPAVTIDGGEEYAGSTSISDSTTVHTVRLDITEGVNFVSVPAATGSLDLSELDTTNVESIMTYQDGQWKSWTPSEDNADDFDELRGGVGYIVKADSDATWDVNVYNTADGGDSATDATPQDTDLQEGWNLVGHWQEGTQPITDALSSLRDSPNGLYGQNVDGEWSYSFPEDNQFTPGEAYWVFVTEDEVYGETQFGLHR